jgi:Cu-processing system ATP-binding protein
MTVTVSVNSVTKSYRAVQALRDVSFDLRPGRLSALVGHNGAGKTTLIKLMLGLIRADRGAIRVLNEDPAAGEFSARRQLGYLPENVAFNSALTGRETLAFYARLKQIKPASAWPLLDRVGLMHAADRRVGTFPRVCGSGWVWPRRCWGGRACCCWMNRQRGSTPRCVRRSTRS